MNLSRIFTAVSSRVLSTSAAVRRSIPGGVECREVTYPVAGKKPKIVSDAKEAVSAIKSGEFS